MSQESHKLMARRFLIDTFSGGKLEILDEILAPDYLDHDAPPGTPPGREGIRYLMGTFQQAFPDLHFAIEDQIVEEDKVLTRWIFHGTQTGELFGIPPTGRRVQFTGMSLYRIANGHMQEAWVNYDALGMMQQLSVVPVPGQ